MLIRKIKISTKNNKLGPEGFFLFFFPVIFIGVYWFTMLHALQAYSKVNLLYKYRCPFFFKILFPIGHSRVLSRGPCVK